MTVTVLVGISFICVLSIAFFFYKVVGFIFCLLFYYLHLLTLKGVFVYYELTFV